MKKFQLIPLAITACFSLLASHAIAKPGKGKGNSSAAHPSSKGKEHKAHKAHKEQKEHKEHKAHKNNDDNKHHHGVAKFEDKERNEIIKLFRNPDGTRQLPPGLAKNLKRGKPLPPGWQKKLSPGYRIEDDIWRSLTPLSYDNFPKVKRVPNTQLYYHDNRVLRVLDATREIVDVISLD